jgi:DNA-binding MarR family transcriptional regulator
MHNDIESKARSVVLLLRRVVGLVYQYSRLMVRQYGITSPQYIALKVLAGAEKPLSSVALSKQLKVTPANITAIVDRLEKKGYVQRSRKSEDRRTVQLELTEAGIAFTSQLVDLMEAKVVEQLYYLDAQDVDSLLRTLEKLVNLMDFEEALFTAAPDEAFKDFHTTEE